MKLTTLLLLFLTAEEKFIFPLVDDDNIHPMQKLSVKRNKYETLSDRSLRRVSAYERDF